MGERRMASTWCIVASGPSLTHDPQDIRSLRKYFRGTVCAVNSSVFAVPWCHVLYAADPEWWRAYRASLQLAQYKGRRVSIRPASRSYGAREVYPVECASKTGLGKAAIRQGGNSGYQAINLAYLEGAREIVLLGFDCGWTFGKRHHHRDHPAGLGNACGVDTWLPRFNALARDLVRAGVRVVNCTRYTRLTCFDRTRLEDYLREHRRA